MERTEKTEQIQISKHLAEPGTIQIVTNIRDLRTSPPTIFLEPHVQTTLFGERRETVTIRELNHAMDALVEDVAETLQLDLDCGDEIAIYNTVNNPIIPRWHVFLRIRRLTGEESFAKVGSADAEYDANRPLKEEEAAFRIANEWGYPPTLGLLTPYQETKQGRGIYELQWIDFSRDGF